MSPGYEPVPGPRFFPVDGTGRDDPRFNRLLIDGIIDVLIEGGYPDASGCADRTRLAAALYAYLYGDTEAVTGRATLIRQNRRGYGN